MKRLSSAFTLIELLVTVVIIAMLATLSISVVGKINAKGRATKCTNFMRQLGTAALLYAGDHEMTLPATTHQRREGIKSWSITLQEYAEGKVTFRCPDDPDKKRAYTYLINDFLTPKPSGAPDLNFSKLAALDRPSSTFLFAEASPAYKNTDHFHFAVHRGQAMLPETFKEQVNVEVHGDCANYVFADGHMETVTWSQVQERLQMRERRFVDPTFEE